MNFFSSTSTVLLALSLLVTSFSTLPAQAQAAPSFLEVGSVSVGDGWQAVTFGQTFSDAVVVAGPAEAGDDDPGAVRVRNITATGFEVRFAEWPYLDGLHAAETVHYLAVERGAHTLASGTVIEAGTATVGDAWVTVPLAAGFSVPPVVLGTVTSVVEAETAAVRIKSPAPDGFDVRLQEQQASPGDHAPESVDYVAWEPGSSDAGTDGITWEAGVALVGGGFQTIPFASTYSAPCVLASQNSFRGADPADVRYRDLTGSAVQLQVDEEQSADAEVGHLKEDVGYLIVDCDASEPPPPPPPADDFLRGTVAVGSSWSPVAFSTPMADPVVVAGPAGLSDPAPGAVRVRNVTSTGFEVRFEEWQYLDDVHAPERVSWLAVERGVHSLASGAIVEAGTGSVATAWSTYPLSGGFSAPPVILATVSSTAEADTVVARVKSVTQAGFSARLQEEQASPGTHVPEVLAYVAWQPGSADETSDGFSWEAGTLTAGSALTTLAFGRSYQSPCLFASQNTTRGLDPADVRHDGLSGSSVRLQVAEEQSADAETSHALEEVGYLVAECGVQSAPAEMSVATNLAQFGHNAEWAFVDRFKMSRPWFSGTLSPPQWNDGRALDLDADGWVRSLQANQVARTTVLGSELPVVPAGEYVVLYDGIGELKYGGGVRRLSVEPGREVLEVESGDTMHLTVVATDPNDYLRNIRVIMPGGIYAGDPFNVVYDPDPGRTDYLSFEQHHETIVFHPDFLTSLDSYSTVRFMNWQLTNSTLQETWTDRPLPTDAQWTIEGVPLEVLMDLANVLQFDPWLNIPHMADDDYVQQFAAMTRDRLDPGLVPHVEYSNGIFDTNLPQFLYARDRGFELGLDTDPLRAAVKYLALRSTEVFAIWESVYGDETGFVSLITTRPWNPWVTELILDYPGVATAIDFISVIAYFGFDAQRNDMCDTLLGMSMDQFFDYVENVSIPTAYAELIDPHLQIAAARGIPVINHEAGQHYRLNRCSGNGAKAAQIDQLFFAANHHPRMKDAYLDFMAGLSARNFHLFNHFFSTGPSDSFGARDHLLQTRAEAPKYDALLSYVESPPPPPPPPPSDPPTGPMGVGTNLALASPHSEWAFVDAFKLSEAWLSGTSEVWEDGGTLDLDEDGWVRSLAPGQEAHTAMLWTELAMRPEGQYVVLYDGIGQLAYEPGATIVSQEPGREVVEVTAEGDGIAMRLVSTDPADYLRNIRVIMPGGIYADDPFTVVYEPDPARTDFHSFEENYETIRFHPDFLSSLNGYAWLRFMNWQRTNQTQQETWDQRPMVSDAQWTIDGVPLEVLIDLTNRMGFHPWFNIPPKADDDYVRQFAETVVALLDPALQPHVEYGNGMLDTTLPQYSYARDEGLARAFDTDPTAAAVKFIALRSREIFEIWEGVFGGPEAFEAIVPSKAFDPWVTATVLDFAGVAPHADSLTVAAYFGFELQWDANCDLVASMTLDDFFAWVAAESIPRALDIRLAPHVTLAHAKGVAVTTQEAGQHYRRNLCGGDTTKSATVADLFGAAQQDARMGQAYADFMDGVSALGVIGFTHYFNTGAIGNFGARRHLLETRSEAPKYDALMTRLESGP